MEKNVGTLDSKIRVGLGALAGTASLLILAGVLTVSSTWALWLGVGSLGLLVNGLTSRCGIYRALGVSTRSE
jgi:hypothetical protein